MEALNAKGAAQHGAVVCAPYPSLAWFSSVECQAVQPRMHSERACVQYLYISIPCYLCREAQSQWSQTSGFMLIEFIGCK